ncbi:MAG: shikimate dehydrogenase, partial [Microbacteriaceae bacterium]|nr:shikimate dehydrogenase [Microbacteriaceae bacterium]
MTPADARLAVLGHPIAHSKSPLLHAAAYDRLGVTWRYDAIDLTTDGLADFIGSRGPIWRGLSLTMPLKREVLPLLDSSDPLVVQTGSANTVLFDQRHGRRWISGFNTDVYGIAEAFRLNGRSRLDVVQILGGGATAASAIAAAGSLGATRVLVSVRTPERATHLVDLGAGLGIEVAIGELSDAAASEPGFSPDAIISTLPNAVESPVGFPAGIRERAVLFDVAYSPWPTSLASSWYEVGGTVIGGLDMLVLQAL